MRYLDLTLPSPERNLACDEALLQSPEESDGDEILRVWEPSNHFVVIGYSGKAAVEVDLPKCRTLGIPVLRRCSGGGAVLQGPGCLNYSLILKIRGEGSLQGISETNRFVMGRLKQALEPLVGPEIGIQGSSDLAVAKRKFSGNAQYRKRCFLLFHGTLLLGLDLSLVEKLLPLPRRQPAYRQNRSHAEFLTNLNLPASVIKQALARAWHATEGIKVVPFDDIERLVITRYASDAWNFKF